MITESKVKKIRKLLEKAVKDIEKSEDVEITFGTMTYTSAGIRCQMNAKTTKITKEVENVNTTLSKSYGFPDNIIGMEFPHAKGTMKITEIRTRNRKYPIIAEVEINGKISGYKFTVLQIKKYLPDNLVIRNKNLEKLSI